MPIAEKVLNADLKDWLLFAMGAIGIAWYYVCLFDLGFRPTGANNSTGFRQFQALSISTISTSLATYVGYISGLPAKTDTAVVGTALARGHATPLQMISVFFYVLSLVIAVRFYWQKKDDADPAVVGLAKSLLGLVAGALTVSFGVPS